jgi:hypothetical protein
MAEGRFEAMINDAEVAEDEVEIVGQARRAPPVEEQGVRPREIPADTLTSLMDRGHVVVVSTKSVRISDEKFNITRKKMKDYNEGRLCYPMPTFILHESAKAWIFNRKVSKRNGNFLTCVQKCINEVNLKKEYFKKPCVYAFNMCVVTGDINIWTTFLSLITHK